MGSDALEQYCRHVYLPKEVVAQVESLKGCLAYSGDTEDGVQAGERTSEHQVERKMKISQNQVRQVFGSWNRGKA